jgi:branched-subunit amino acid transport protein
MPTLDPTYLILVIVGMTVATFPTRVLPMLYFNKVGVPRIVERWLAFVPIALFAAILVQTVVPRDGAWSVAAQVPLFAGCIAAVICGTKTRSLGWGTVTGFALYVVLTLIVSS